MRFVTFSMEPTFAPCSPMSRGRPDVLGSPDVCEILGGPQGEEPIVSPSAARTRVHSPRRSRVSNENLMRSLNRLSSDIFVLNERLEAVASIIIKGTVSSSQMSLFPLLRHDFAVPTSTLNVVEEVLNRPSPIARSPSPLSLEALWSPDLDLNRENETTSMPSESVLTQELPSLISPESISDSGADIETPSPSTPLASPPRVLGKRTYPSLEVRPDVAKRLRFMLSSPPDPVEVVDLCTPSPSQEEQPGSMDTTP